MCRFTVGERDDARLAEAEEREQLRKASGAWLARSSASGATSGDGVAYSGRSVDKDEVLRVGVEAKEDGISNLYVLHDEFLPLVKRATLMLAPRTPVSRPEKCYIESSRGYVGETMQTVGFLPDSGFGRVVCVGYGHRGACGSLEDGFQWQESQCVALRTDGQRFWG